jgi:ribosomal protein L16 Arg81 hydroxylase
VIPNVRPIEDAKVVPRDLAEVLAPYGVDEFLGSCWGKRHLHLSGWPGKFSDLMPWSRLNEILEQYRLETPRLRLALEGKILPPEQFMRHGSLSAMALAEELRRGATLVVDGVDEFHEPLTELAEALERLFHVRIQVSAYAGWRHSHGFDVHWDDVDVFILQVAGQKRWTVFGPTRRQYPFRDDVETDKEPPRPPLWEDVLQEGDVLYIPRGWWHVAVPLDEPTLHLTVGGRHPTGVDLLSWLVDELRGAEIARMDLPRFASKDERQQHMATLRDALLEAWGPDLLERYFERADGLAMPRPRLNLPWDATPDVLPPGDDVRLRLTAPRPLDLHVDPSRGVVIFSCNGKRWEFDEAAELVLRPLATGKQFSVAQLCALARPTISRAGVRDLIRELVVDGLIVTKRG